MKAKTKRFIRACAYSTRWMPNLPAPLRNNRWLHGALLVASCPIGFLNYLRVPRPEDEPADGWMVVAIAKDEAKDIGEWIEYYKLCGADRIAVFDNGSTDDTAKIVKSYRDQGVDYHALPGTVRQLDAYNQALRMYRNRYRYMAIVDCDEFLYCDAGDLYSQIDAQFRIQGRSDVGGIGVNELVFGSSGHDRRPEGGVLRNYLWRCKDTQPMNILIKTVCMPSRTLGFVNPHYAIYRKGYVCVDANGRPFHGARTDFGLTEKIRINHYFTKSKEDWLDKMGRGKADMLERRQEEEFGYQDNSDVFDDRIVHVLDALADRKPPAR